MAPESACCVKSGRATQSGTLQLLDLGALGSLPYFPLSFARGSARGYNPGVGYSDCVFFDVAAQDDGGFSAYARVGTFSMLTQGETLEELRARVAELIDDYNFCQAEEIAAFALIFNAPGLTSGTDSNVLDTTASFGSASA